MANAAKGEYGYVLMEVRPRDSAFFGPEECKYCKYKDPLSVRFVRVLQRIDGKIESKNFWICPECLVKKLWD